MVKNRASAYVCVAALLLYGLVTVAGGKWQRHTVIKSDAAGYYAYLPALFIYNDALKCRHYPYVDSVYNPADGIVYYAVQYYQPTGNMYFKYTYGVALLQMPLFLVAHALTKATGAYPADGYSAFYQLAVALNTVLFAFLGLLVLRRFLLLYFTDTVTALTLAVIAVGTNFLAQVITQPGIAHIYLFFLYAVILYTAHRWHETNTAVYGLLLSTAIGLTIAVRPTDAVVALLPLLWPITRNGFNSALNGWWQNRFKLLPMLLIALLPILLQAGYWKAATGHWLFYTYKNEHFNFSNWQIINGLFSYRKGWLVYTPLAALGFAGMYMLWQNKQWRFYVVPALAYFAVTLYYTFCWWQWYYGGSFGCRVLVQSLALLAMPTAAFIAYLLNARSAFKWGGLGMVTLLVGLNVFQTGQYAKGIIHWQKMNKEYYWRVFGRWQVSDADKQLLLQTEELTTVPR